MGLDPISIAAFTWIGSAAGATAATAAGTGAAIVGSTAAIAGAGYSAYSQYQAGKSAQALNNYNADLAARDSATASRDAAIQANQVRRQGQRVMAKQRAAFAASGVVGETGSPLLVEAEQAGYLEMNALETERQGNMRAGQFAQQAALDRMEGRAARSAGNLNSFATILGGVGSAASSYERGKARNAGYAGI